MNHVISYYADGGVFTVGDLFAFTGYGLGGVFLFAVALNCLALIFPKERD